MCAQYYIENCLFSLMYGTLFLQQMFGCCPALLVFYVGRVGAVVGVVDAADVAVDVDVVGVDVVAGDCGCARFINRPFFLPNDIQHSSVCNDYVSYSRGPRRIGTAMRSDG